ncbi:MAG: cohesin domain-containing protein [Candidatus Bipolaricaulia bacterium]
MSQPLSRLRRTFGLALLVGGLLFGLTLSGAGPTTALAQEGESTTPTQASITLLTALMDDVAAEAEEGEFNEALELVDRFEGVLNEVRGLLIESAGEVAEAELAEIDDFLPRLREALNAGNTDQATTVIDTIQGELAEIASAAVGPADSATAALDRIDELLATIIEEIEEAEFEEAFTLTERLEGLIEANRELLVNAAGDVAEEELAEITEIIGRLETALEEESAEDAISALEVIREEFAEIREALDESDGETAAATVGVSSAEVAAGETATVTLDVSGLSAPLGAYNLTISFDASVVELTDVSVSYGTALPEPQIDNEAGTVRVQGIKPENAKSGDLQIAEMTFEAVGSSGQSTSLTPSVDELADSDGQPIEASVQSGSVTIQ